MAVLSDITNDNTCNITQTIRNDTSNDNVKLVGGWRKGSTKAARKKKEQQVSDVVSQCALKFQEQVEKAKKAGKVVPHGTLKDIIKEEEEKNGLEVNSISFETV
jgi:hypothetical protein